MEAHSCSLAMGDSAVQLPFAPGIDHLRDIFDALNSHTPAGNSPLAAALDRAYHYFIDGLGQCFPGSRWVFLVSTGAADCNPSLSCTSDRCVPNSIDTYISDATCPAQLSDPNCCSSAGHRCFDDTAVVDQIGRLASAGIRTLVVGVPSSDQEIDLLNRSADVGGVTNPNQPERFFWLGEGHSGESDLAQLLGTMTTQLIRSCDIELSRTPVDVSTILVSIDCTLVPADLSADASGNGWVLNQSYSPPHLQFTGTYCERISTTGANYVDIVYDCPE